MSEVLAALEWATALRESSTIIAHTVKAKGARLTKNEQLPFIQDHRRIDQGRPEALKA